MNIQTQLISDTKFEKETKFKLISYKYNTHTTFIFKLVSILFLIKTIVNYIFI